MDLNDFLTVSPIIFDDGWTQAPSPPLPSFLKDKAGTLHAFFNKTLQIGVNISLEDKNGPPYLHLSMRHNGGVPIPDETAMKMLKTFFPDATLAKDKEEVWAGQGWVERRGVGMVPTVRHFSKFLKEKP